jgi:glycosyltransferase involved in cell wall biosynthesis
MDERVRRVVGIVKFAVLRLAHALLLTRLRIEAWLASSGKPSRSPRIMASGTWTFPVYSQTFVHQEILALARGGSPLRFLYARLGPRVELAHTSEGLWRHKRRVLLHATTGALDLAHYRRSRPAQVEALTGMIAAAAGMRREDLERHTHFLQAFSFARSVEAWKTDYLHSYFFYEQAFFALVASQLLGVPRGISCYSDHMLQDYPLKLVKLHLQTCDVIVATSQRIRAELESLYGAPLPQIIVKPNAIDASGFPKKSGWAPVVGRPLRMLCVSRIDPKKGIEHLIDAVRLLTDDGVAVEARIVGAPDSHPSPGRDYEEALRTRVAELGLVTAILFAGRRTSREVRGFLEEADIFVAPYVDLPSGDKDGIPTALLEAMAVGSVIVATDAGSIREVIEDGREGLIVPQRDPAALAAAVRRLREDEALARRLGKGAASRARKEYDVGRSEVEFHDRVRAAVEARRQSRKAVSGAGVSSGAPPAAHLT